MASASTPVESVPPQPVPPASSPEDLEAAARREELQKQVDDAEGEGQGGLVWGKIKVILPTSFQAFSTNIEYI